MKVKFILASESPRRRELLEKACADFKTVPSGIDEKFREGESPRGHVLRLAREKAAAVSRENPGVWVLGADTGVIVDNEVLGKPATSEAAKTMLKKLNGRMHRVITGFSITNESAGVKMDGIVESQVFFREIFDEEMDWYVKTGEPFGKAGGYAVQGSGAVFVKEIRGSHTNVIGLPLCEVVSALKSVGVIDLS